MKKVTISMLVVGILFLQGCGYNEVNNIELNDNIKNEQNNNLESNIDKIKISMEGIRRDNIVKCELNDNTLILIIDEKENIIAPATKEIIPLDECSFTCYTDKLIEMLDDNIKNIDITITRPNEKLSCKINDIKNNLETNEYSMIYIPTEIISKNLYK